MDRWFYNPVSKNFVPKGFEDWVPLTMQLPQWKRYEIPFVREQGAKKRGMPSYAEAWIEEDA